MGQTVPQIEAHIDQTRRRLGQHLEELEQKVESATDWRQYVRARPVVILGAALAGGLLLGSRGRRGPSSPSRPAVVKAQTMETWDNIRTALVGVAVAKVTSYIATLIPGFDEHLQKAEQRNGVRL